MLFIASCRGRNTGSAGLYYFIMVIAHTRLILPMFLSVIRIDDEKQVGEAILWCIVCVCYLYVLINIEYLHRKRLIPSDVILLHCLVIVIWTYSFDSNTLIVYTAVNLHTVAVHVRRN